MMFGVIVFFFGFWRRPALTGVRIATGSGTRRALGMENSSTTRSGLTNRTFFVLETPEITDWLVGNYSEQAFQYFEKSLAEEKAEIWLHHGFREYASSEHTHDPLKADVIVVPGYLHLNRHLLESLGVSTESLSDLNLTTFPYQPQNWIPVIVARLRDLLLARLKKSSTPLPLPAILLSIPTWNPGVGGNIGLASFVESIESMLSSLQVEAQHEGDGHELSPSNFSGGLWSLGFERNENWQFVDATKIIPVPYVVTVTAGYLASIAQSSAPSIDFSAKNISVFFAGDPRPHAVRWGGCNRTALAKSLVAHADSSVDVRVLAEDNRLSSSEYRRRIRHSKFCLVMCGDTPSSRTLAESMVHQCIPVLVGKRLLGSCEDPCRNRWGWTVSSPQYPHIPYSDQIDWLRFPIIPEQDFLDDAYPILQQTLPWENSSHLQNILWRTRTSWIYGTGNPVTYKRGEQNRLGGAVPAIWKSAAFFLLGSSLEAD
jgi:Exostosin family